MMGRPVLTRNMGCAGENTVFNCGHVDLDMPKERLSRSVQRHINHASWDLPKAQFPQVRSPGATMSPPLSLL
jgi:hypothetical protein